MGEAAVSDNDVLYDPARALSALVSAVVWLVRRGCCAATMPPSLPLISSASGGSVTENVKNDYAKFANSSERRKGLTDRFVGENKCPPTPYPSRAFAGGGVWLSKFPGSLARDMRFVLGAINTGLN